MFIRILELCEEKKRERKRESDTKKKSRRQLPQHCDEEVKETKKKHKNEREEANTLYNKRERKLEIKNSKPSKTVFTKPSLF